MASPTEHNSTLSFLLFLRLPKLYTSINQRYEWKLPTAALFGLRNREYWVGGICGAYGGDEKCIQNFRGETWEKVPTWYFEVDGKIILIRVLKKYGCRALTGLSRSEFGQMASTYREGKGILGFEKLGKGFCSTWGAGSFARRIVLHW